MQIKIWNISKYNKDNEMILCKHKSNSYKIDVTKIHGITKIDALGRAIYENNCNGIITNLILECLWSYVEK